LQKNEKSYLQLTRGEASGVGDENEPARGSRMPSEESQPKNSERHSANDHRVSIATALVALYVGAGEAFIVTILCAYIFLRRRADILKFG
jgi:hypothetical protein